MNTTRRLSAQEQTSCKSFAALSATNALTNGTEIVGNDDIVNTRSGFTGTLLYPFLLLAALLGMMIPDGALAQGNRCLTDTVRINTGWDHAANAVHPIPSYTPYWRVVADPAANTTEPRPAAVIQKHAAWAVPLPGSQWISAYPNSSNDLNGVYTFEFCFCLGPQAERPRLFLDILADDSAAVYLNGNLVGSTAMARPPYPFQNVTHLSTLNPQFFRPGKNCIQVKLHNLSSVAMGLNISGYVTANGVGLVAPHCCDSTGVIMGRKFWDQNCNGKREQGEPALAGWTFNLSNGQQATTDALGNYYFFNVPPGTYLVTETNQPGWTQTYPASGGHTVTLGANQVISNVDFGNCRKEQPDTCLLFGDYKIDCIKIPGTTQTGYSLTSYIKSYMANCGNQQAASITSVSPAGISVTPGSFSLSTSFQPVNFTISGPGATPGTVVSIAIRVCCVDATGQDRCCTDTLKVRLPECPQEQGCFRLVEQTIECKQTPNGVVFEWCFNVINQSNFTAFYFNLIPPGGVGASPGTIIFPSGLAPNAVSPRYCVTLSGPGATPGASLLFYVRMCDRERKVCCTDSVRITLPKCPLPPKGCCDEFMKRFAKVGNSASSNGNASVNGFLWAAGTGAAPITGVSASLVSVTVNGAPAWGHFVSGTIAGLGAGAVPPPPYSYPFSQDIQWGPTFPTTLMGAPFNFNLKFPPMAPKAWKDVLRYCIRFRYTDKNCVTCDTVLCFTRVRYRFIILDGPILHGPFFPKSKQSDERGIQSAGGSTISGELTGSDSGTLAITFPPAPEGVGQIEYIGLTITPADTTVSIDDATASSSAYDLFFLERGMLAYFSANPGQSVSFGMRYKGLGERLSLPHQVSFTVVVDGDTLTETVDLTLRRGSAVGGDKLSAASSSLRDLRTYALHLRNSNGSQEPVDRLVITTDGDVKIVAVGPTADASQAVLEFGAEGGRKFTSESNSGAVALEAGSEHGPIYLTLAGVPGDATTIHFVTIDANGQTISEGDLTLSGPLSSVENDDTESGASAIMLRGSYPNPASGAATITFTLQGMESGVSLSVSDAAGREVARLMDGQTLGAGDHAVYFNAADLPSGTYFYTLRAGGKVETRSLQVVK